MVWGCVLQYDPVARAKTTSGTQGNLGSISAVSRVQSLMLPEKDEWGLIFKTAAGNRTYKRQKGTAKGYIQSERMEARSGQN